MKKLLVATMALATLAGSATTALASSHNQTAGTPKGTNQCASHAAGVNLGQSAAALSGTSIRLSWSDWCDGETEFHILRSATPGGTFTSVGNAAGGSGSSGAALSYDDTGLVCETTYYYKLEAHKHSSGNGEQSSVSAEFSGTTGACAVEGKPAQAIANGHLRPGSPAALQCENVLGSNWHGDVLSAAHVEFGTRKFTPSEEHEVTDWIDTDICA